MDHYLTIPKIIHYCWFGGNPIPNSAIKCIESWKKYLPDYKIIEWNENNFSIENCPMYVKQAYEQRKWAFVSDYARFKILYENGGLYFDTDVELIKPIDDIILCGPFMGCEQNSKCNPGLGLAAAPGLGLYQEILDYYEHNEFDPTGSTTVVQITSNILNNYGFKDVLCVQHIEGVNIYPPEFFSPIDLLTGKLRITENTRSIHHYDATWLDPKTKYAREKARILRRVFPARISGLIAELLACIRYEGIHEAFSKLLNWAKK